MDIIPIGKLQEAANNDPEFQIAARFWESVLRIGMGDSAHLIHIKDGRIAEVVPWHQAQGLWTSWNVSIWGPAQEWRKLLEPIPEPFYQDLWGAIWHHGFEVEGDLETFYQYYPAIRRMFDLMRAIA